MNQKFIIRRARSKAQFVWDSMDGFICPRCGKRTMIKKEVEQGKYKLICSKCGFQHRMLPKDDKKRGFV